MIEPSATVRLCKSIDRLAAAVTDLTTAIRENAPRIKTDAPHEAPSPDPQTIKEFAETLLYRTARRDKDGRSVGFSYADILGKIKERFPVINHGGPHKGKPIKMTIRGLQRLAYVIQCNHPGVPMPRRPRGRTP